MWSSTTFTCCPPFPIPTATFTFIHGLILPLGLLLLYNLFCSTIAHNSSNQVYWCDRCTIAITHSWGLVILSLANTFPFSLSSLYGFLIGIFSTFTCAFQISIVPYLTPFYLFVDWQNLKGISLLVRIAWPRWIQICKTIHLWLLTVWFIRLSFALFRFRCILEVSSPFITTFEGYIMVSSSGSSYYESNIFKTRHLSFLAINLYGFSLI